MTLLRARVRYLSAIGAVLPSVAMGACKDAAPPVAATIDADASGTSSPTASVATVTPPTTKATGAPETSVTPPPSDPVPPKLHVPSCPNGKFCVAEPAKLDGRAAAPAPFGKCAQVATHPDDKPDAGSRFHRSVTFNAEATTAERATDKTACCYTWVIPCPGGRAFRDATGTPTVARTMARTDWASLRSASVGAIAVDHLASDVRASLAEHWMNEAAFEHASVASFAQLTLDLMAVGAPPELLAASQRAGIDEVEHAQLAFALAAAYGAETSGPAPLAASPGAHRSLPEIARTTFIDACVGESVAAAALAEDARLAEEAGDPVLRDVLEKMAQDEERHAELAWRIVAWALRAGGEEVARVLTVARDEVIDELVSLSHDVAASTRRHELRATVLREVVLPCAVALVTTRSAEEIETEVASMVRPLRSPRTYDA